MPGVLPGFKPTLGITVVYLSLIVLIPLAGLVLKTSELSLSEFWTTISGPRALATYWLSFGGALLAAVINTVCGLVVAWVLVRYRFPGKGIVDALVDLPLALPTAVAGIALTAIYSKNGWIGSLLEPHGIKSLTPRSSRSSTTGVAQPGPERLDQRLVVGARRRSEWEHADADGRLGAGERGPGQGADGQPGE